MAKGPIFNRNLSPSLALSLPDAMHVTLLEEILLD